MLIAVILIYGGENWVIGRSKVDCPRSFVQLHSREFEPVFFYAIPPPFNCYTRLLLLRFTTSHISHVRNLKFRELKSFAVITLTSNWWSKKQKWELLEGNGWGIKNRGSADRPPWGSKLTLGNHLCQNPRVYFIVTPNATGSSVLWA